jgi:5,10-methylenetetrahydrofolate reductase
MVAHPFELICEIEPPTTPDLDHVRRQIETLGSVASSFLIPDNHIGRATVSSVAVAHEVEVLGGRSIACLNARDRNLLGFQRDLLTAAAYGVDQFLFVYGDKPISGGRTGELTVRTMMDEARALAARPGLDRTTPFRVGAVAGPGALPAWKRQADFLFVQVAFSLGPLLRWREQIDVDVPVYAGVMTLASATMAANLAASIPDIHIPPTLVRSIELDRDAGVEAACELVLQVRDSGAFDGVHLVPVSRYRQVAARLEGSIRAG